MAGRERLTPTLFDQLVADHRSTGSKDDPERSNAVLGPFSRYQIPQIRTFNINDLRASIRRELDELLNVTALESAVDLTPYPEVRTSVLNFGLPDIAGRTYSRTAKAQRQRDLVRIIRTFEPRLEKVQVEWQNYTNSPEEISFTIRGDISNAAGGVPVRFKTKLEVDTASFKVES